MVNASNSLSVFINFPTAVQFPGDAHDTEVNNPERDICCSPVSNTASCAVSHTPFVDVMVNASKPALLFLNIPTAVQFSADAHDTELNNAIGELLWIPVSNTAGRAVLHTSFVDVMVNASKPPLLFLNCPTVAQFPGEEHDTEDVYIAFAEGRSMPS
jgi:hypothetical protein